MANPSACPLHEVRKLGPAAAIDWIDGLSREEKEFLLQYHQCCLLVEWERDWSRRFRSLENDSVPVAATQEDRERGAVSAGLR